MAGWLSGELRDGIPPEHIAQTGAWAGETFQGVRAGAGSRGSVGLPWTWMSMDALVGLPWAWMPVDAPWPPAPTERRATWESVGAGPERGPAWPPPPSSSRRGLISGCPTSHPRAAAPLLGTAGQRGAAPPATDVLALPAGTNSPRGKMHLAHSIHPAQAGKCFS